MPIKLKNLSVYDPVNNKPYVIGIDENNVTVDFLHLGVDDSGKVRLLRCNASDQRRINSTDVAHYDGCEADVWLNNESTGYLSRLDSATRNALSSTSIKIKDENDGTIYEIARRCFLLSHTEYGFDNTGAEGPSYLEVFKTWKNTTNANTARIATNDSGSVVGAWLRSPCNASQFCGCGNNGNAYYVSATRTDYWLRPALSFDPDTYVTDPDENNHCFLLPDPTKLYRELECDLLMDTPTKTPVEGILQLSYADLMTGYPKAFITTNYSKGNPVTDWQEVPIGQPFDINGNGKNIGLKLYGRTQSNGCINEPILNTGGEKDDVE